MIDPKQIPDAVVEAAWPHVCEASDPRLPTCKEPCSHCLAGATAALRAGIAAWPGMLTERRARCDAVVLPFNLDADIGVIALPTETTNAEG